MLNILNPITPMTIANGIVKIIPTMTMDVNKINTSIVSNVVLIILFILFKSTFGFCKSPTNGNQIAPYALF